MDDLKVDDVEDQNNTKEAEATSARVAAETKQKSGILGMLGRHSSIVPTIGSRIPRPSIFGSAAVQVQPSDLGVDGATLDGMLRAAKPKDILFQVKRAFEDDDKPYDFDAGNREVLRQKSLMLEIYNNENLGEDFLDTPWVPPSVKLAKEFRSKQIFKGGDAKYTSVTLTDSFECGSGLPLYFQFLKSMAVCFLIMSLLSIPAIIINGSGTSIVTQDRDVVGLYKYSLGNIGYSTTDSDYLDKSTCKSDTLHVTANSTCITILNDIQITKADAGLIITAFEFLQVLVFFLVLLFLNIRHNQLTDSSYDSNVNVSRYSVLVTNISADTKVDDLVQHFSSLYQLSETDFKHRPPLAGAEPVDNLDLSRNKMLKGTWVAEASIFSRIGKLIRAYRNDVSLQEQLFRSRALMKMYNKNTSHFKGHNFREYSRAQFQMLETAKRIEANTHVLLLNYRLTDNANKNKVSPDDMAIEDTIRADAICGCVIFNYSESMARCVEDYARYSYWPMSMFYPDNLKLKGRKVKVFRAPEPDEIIWENLEISKFEKAIYRTLNNLISLVLLIIGFLIILQAAVNNVKFSKSLPDFALCKAEIPALYKGSYAIDTNSISLERPSNASLTRIYDDACDKVISGSFYGRYVYDDDNTRPLANYDIRTCSQTAYTSWSGNANPPTYDYGECPHYNQSTFCPCLSLSGKETCSTLACSTLDSGSDISCRTFPSKSVAACYCYQNLRSIFLSLISVSGSAYTKETTECKSFFANYVSAIGLTYAASVATVIINYLLKYFFTLTTKNEYHNSTDQEQGSLIYKIFLVIYINMAFVVLVAYGYLVDSPEDLKKLYILQGRFLDYTAPWYGQVGAYLCFTFILNVPVPYFWSMPDYLIFQPYLRWRLFRDVEKRNQKRLAMQHDVNLLEVGPPFDYSSNSAFLLAMIFFAMTFAPGLPLLMPIICGMFCFYLFMDKLLVLRYFRKPPHISGGVNKIMLTFLPYAAILRLCNACWMFGNSDILPSARQSLGFIPGLGGSADPHAAQEAYDTYLATHSTGPGFYAVSRITRTNVFPLFVFLCIVVGVMLLRMMWRQLPFYWILKLLAYVFQVCCRQKGMFDIIKSDGKVHGPDLAQLGDTKRMEMAPYTGTYFKYLRKVGAVAPFYYDLFCLNWNLRVSELEKQEGWDISVDPKENYYIKIKKWMKAASKGSDGYRAKDSLKYTYEAVADNGCYSYLLEKIPEYQLAITGLKEGAKNLRASMLMSTDMGTIMGSVAARFQQKEKDKKVQVLEQKSKAASDAANIASESRKKRDDVERSEYKPNTRSSFVGRVMAQLDNDD